MDNADVAIVGAGSGGPRRRGAGSLLELTGHRVALAGGFSDAERDAVDAAMREGR